MILRSVMKHVKEQNWVAVCLDFFIVVVGVFIGIQVANWNDARAERNLEVRYLQRLETALARDIVEHDDAVDLAEKRRDRGRLLMAALEDASIARDHPSELFDAVLVAGFTYHPNISDTVFDEMVATGNARIIRDETLRDAIANYYGAIEAQAQWNYIREHTQLTYMDRRSGVLTSEETRRAWLADGSAEFTTDEARDLVERIGAKPGFVEWLPYAENWQLEQARFYENLGASARDLRARIREALGLTPLDPTP